MAGNRNSIQQKIMSAVLFTTTVVLLLMCGAYLLFEYESYKNTVKNNVSALAAVVASNSSASLAFQSRNDAIDILSALKTDPHITMAALYDEKGKLFVAYPESLNVDQVPARPKLMRYTFANGVLEGYQPVLQGSSRLGTLYIQSDLKEIDAQLANLITVAGVLFAVSLLVAYLISYVLQRRITKPISLLEKTALAISGMHDYSIRAVKTTEDETGSLTDAFNAMLSQIESQNEAIIEAAVETNKLAAIVESSNDAIISITMDGIISSWNDGAQRTFGYTAPEAIGQPIFIIVPDGRQQEEADVLERLKNGAHIQQFETQRITKNKKVLDVSISISPVKDSRGTVIGSSKIARDISDRKQAERRKNDFIGMVSHELKTPLTSVRTYVQMLLAEAKKRNSDGFIINALTRTDVQTKKMAHMIHDFLNLARLEDGKVQLQKQAFDLDELITETVGDAQLFTSNHTIRLELCDGLLVLADRDKIGQVVMNLLTNAIKYSPKGGEIVVSCKASLNKVVIRVTDQGIGISAADQRKLFERFYRVEGEQIGTISGFGIGLYLVSEILRYHGSKIEVESREGEGSSFHFALDISDQEKA